jgi:hypothetical protein
MIIKFAALIILCNKFMTMTLLQCYELVIHKINRQVIEGPRRSVPPADFRKGLRTHGMGRH